MGIPIFCTKNDQIFWEFPCLLYPCDHVFFRVCVSNFWNSPLVFLSTDLSEWLCKILSESSEAPWGLEFVENRKSPSQLWTRASTITALMSVLLVQNSSSLLFGLDVDHVECSISGKFDLPLFDLESILLEEPSLWTGRLLEYFFFPRNVWCLQYYFVAVTPQENFPQ